MSNRTIFNYVNIYNITAFCNSPMHIGGSDSDNGEILVHPVSGLPFIQASGIAGSFRDYALNNFDKKTCINWFGTDCSSANDFSTDDGRSRLVFTDGYFQKNGFNIELRTRVKLNPITGSTASENVQGSKSGQLLETEYISKGSIVNFEIYEYFKDKNEKTILKDCLAALDNADILIGGQLSNGCGQLSLKSVHVLECDMTSEEGRKKWISRNKKEQPKNMTDITSKLKNISTKSDDSIDFYMNVSFDKSVLVKGDTIDKNILSSILGINFDDNSKRPPDVMQLMDGNKNFIIPGSSIKGVLRNRIESIINYKKLDKEIIDILFEGRSHFYFYDVCLDNNKINLVSRNHIDKFTGGVISSGLFQEAVNGGDTSIHIKFKTITDKENINKIAPALLTLALRDCAIGEVSIGSGFSIGRGFMNVKEIKATKNSKELFTITNKSNEFIINDSSKTINTWLKALQS